MFLGLILCQNSRHSLIFYSIFGFRPLAKLVHSSPHFVIRLDISFWLWGGFFFRLIGSYHETRLLGQDLMYDLIAFLSALRKNTIEPQHESSDCGTHCVQFSEVLLITLIFGQTLSEAHWILHRRIFVLLCPLLCFLDHGRTTTRLTCHFVLSLSFIVSWVLTCRCLSLSPFFFRSDRF